MRRKKVEECKKKKGGLAEGQRDMGVEWNHNTMKHGPGKLQMKQLTKITENTLEKMYL